MVLELLKHAKFAIKNFDQSEASIVVMWLPMDGEGHFRLTIGHYRITIGHYFSFFKQT